MRRPFFILMLISCVPPLGWAFASSTDDPAPPTSSASAMYSLEDIYNRLAAGSPGSLRTGGFTQPASGPGAALTLHTLNDVMNSAPNADDSNGASPELVLSGKTFWNLQTNGWGPGVGTMANNGSPVFTPGTTTQTLATGYYSGGTVNGDANLAGANIKSGVTIFGVAGSTSVVDTANATAAASDLAGGKTAYVNGNLVTGSVPVGVSFLGGNGELVLPIPAGLYDGTSTATAVDGNLAGANILSGVTIFGVAGTAGLSELPEPVLKTGAGPLPGYTLLAGEDGSLQKGLPLPKPRFTNNNNGTVLDNKTGLIWLANANAFGQQTWAQALAACNTLASGAAGLTDGSTAGQWRLPNVCELQSLCYYGYFNPALSNDAGAAQWSSGAGSSFTGIQLYNGITGGYYWTSTTYTENFGNAWFLYMYDGGVNDSPKTATYYVWPVRGGE